MRTTLDIDDDVLQAAKDLARRQQITAEVTVNAAGFRPLPSRGVLVSNELVNALRDREGV